MTAFSLKSLTSDKVARKCPVDDGLPGHVYRDAVELVHDRAPDLPVLCFSQSRLQCAVRRFLDGFPGTVSYAVKANSAPDVLGCIAGTGVRVFDVASVKEMAEVAAVAEGCRFHYHNPVKSRREIAAAHETYGCRRFAADSVAEIDKIAEVVGAGRSGMEIAIRFRLPSHGQSTHDFSSKFGVGPDEAVGLLRYAADLGFRCVLTFHPGSQCNEPLAWDRHIQVAGDIAKAAGVDVCTLNVGGGFPVRYAGSAVVDLSVFFDTIRSSTRSAFEGLAMPGLECEPGRAMVADCQSVVARVKLVKPERREVFLNDGIYGCLMEISQAPELTPPHRAIRQNGLFAADGPGWTVFGPTCDPLDTLPVKLALPGDVAEDDYIEFGTIGAYGSATATGFNGYGEFERVLVEGVLTA